MVNRFWSGLITLLLLSGCGWDGTPTRKNDFTPLTSITISAVSSSAVPLTIANGTSTKLIATGHFSGQFSRDVTDQVVWSSDKPTVADFKYAAAPNLNRVTAVAPGSAVIHATLDGISAPDYPLTVSNATVTAMTITPATASKAKGLTTQFEANGVFSDASNQNLTFDAAWSSDNIAVATVNDPTSRGLAKGIAEGSAKITATFGGILPPPTATLTVTAATLQSITVTPANSSISGVSKTKNFTAMGIYSDGTTVDKTTAATWSSSATNIATITSSGGVVTATSVAVGTTVISATLKDSITLVDIIGRTNLTVTAPVLNSNGLQITPSNPFVQVNMTQQLTVTATFDDGSTSNVTSNCSWTSSAPSIVSVSPTGVVTTGNFVGSSVITATYSGQSVSTTITVQ